MKKDEEFVIIFKTKVKEARVFYEPVKLVLWV